MLLEVTNMQVNLVFFDPKNEVFLYSLFLAFKLWSPQTKNIVIVFLSILAVQIFLGVNNILSSLPLWNAVAHNIVGVMLFLTFIVMIYLSKGNLNEPK